MEHSTASSDEVGIVLATHHNSQNIAMLRKRSPSESKLSNSAQGLRKRRWCEFGVARAVVIGGLSGWRVVASVRLHFLTYAPDFNFPRSPQLETAHDERHFLCWLSSTSERWDRAQLNSGSLPLLDLSRANPSSSCPETTVYGNNGIPSKR